jgi:hypothetical protein
MAEHLFFIFPACGLVYLLARLLLSLSGCRGSKTSSAGRVADAVTPEASQEVRDLAD